MSKYYNYAFLLYPESCSDDFKSVLAATGQKIFYILHNNDILEDGTPKKPHYHVMIMYENQRSQNTVIKLCKSCGGNGHIEILDSAKGYARYLLHMDNPEKYQYNVSEIHSLCGADYEKIALSETETKANKTKLITDMIQFVEDNDIEVYADFIAYCSHNRPEWLDILISRKGIIVKDYIKSRSWANRYGQDYRRFDYDTEKR